MPLPALRIPLELCHSKRPEVLRAVQLAALARAQAQRQRAGKAEGGGGAVSRLHASCANDISPSHNQQLFQAINMGFLANSAYARYFLLASLLMLVVWCAR